MLPGFRFLFAAIVLSMSMLIFGLGAASLFRAAHEQFASIPSRPAPPEAVFAQRPEVTSPTLAMLRIDAPPGDDVTDRVAVVATSNEQASTAIEADKPAAAPSAEPENAIPEAFPRSEGPQSGATQGDVAQNNTASAPNDAPTPAADIKIASTETTATPASDAVAPASTASTVASPTADAVASPKVATLGNAPLTAEPTVAAKKAVAKTDTDAAIKRRRAERARERRKHRLRLARARPVANQQFTTTTDPFTQQPTTQQATSSSPAPVVRTR